jgi:hypothetical protein
MFANTQYCWQQCVKHTRCQLFFQIAGLYSKTKTKKCWYIEIVNFI